MNSSINDKLTPGERAFLLRDLGFKIRKNKGQINNIKNINYDDNNPDLCINLDTGETNDFGDSSYSGDVIDLISLTINKDFSETIKYIQKKLNRKLFNNDQTEALYGRPEPSGKASNGSNGSTEEPVKKFWNAKNWKRMQKCQQVLEKRGIPNDMEYIQDYDGISFETLKEMKCGLYGFGDYEFGLSSKNYNKDLYFIFPYFSGAMLYRRTEKGKEVLNIKGSKPKGSFFNVEKEEDPSEVVFLMKSPRECMSFSQYCTDWKTIGLSTGETVRSLSNVQKEQLDRVVKTGGMINVILDCDNSEAYENALILCNLLNKHLEDRALVYLCNISKHSEKEFKDFTDLIHHSQEGGYWNSYDTFTLDDKASKTLTQSITKSQITR